MTQPASQPTTVLDYALLYASLGWPVVPIHSVESGKCSCKRGSGCDDKGKHPRTEHGLSDATTDTTQIEAWWKRWPNSNIGIRTDDLPVLDIDKKSGGPEGLKDLELTYGELPTTPRAKTGGGGEHILFSGQTKNSVRKLAPGVDTRGTGGYIVAPPSVHESGAKYEWTCAPTTPLATLPDWVNSLLGPDRPRSQSQPMADKIIKGGRNETLFKQACADRARGREFDEIFAAVSATNKLRCQPPVDDMELRKIVESACKYEVGTGKAFVVSGEIITPDNVDCKWMNSLQTKESGALTKAPGNAALYLTNHQDWNGALAFDEFSGKIFWKKDPPAVKGMATPVHGEVQEHHYIYVQQWFASCHDVQFGKDAICDALIRAAHEQSYHPVREYLTGLEWNQQPYVDRFLAIYFGADDSPYTRLIGRWFLLSAVARILDPGVKVDSMPVFEGDQGSFKSSALKELTNPWFSDTPLDLMNKDAYQSIRGVWMYELAELESLKVNSSRAKAFLSSSWDRYRPVWEKSARDFPRQTVFAGTVNHSQYLKDESGGRRFHPVKCGKIDIKGIKRDRDQIWAEAVHLYRTDPCWWPRGKDQVEWCKAAQSSRYRADAWEIDIAEYLKTKTHVTVNEILSDCLGITKDKWDEAAQRKVYGSLAHLGWVSTPAWDSNLKCTVRVYSPRD